MRSGIRQILVFSFVVLVILVRPFAAYQISTMRAYANDQEKILALLQRLIKKKESFAHGDEEVIDCQATEEITLLPAVIILLRKFFSFLFKTNLFEKINYRYSTVFQLIPNNHFYRQVAQFLI